MVFFKVQFSLFCLILCLGYGNGSVDLSGLFKDLSIDGIIGANGYLSKLKVDIGPHANHRVDITKHEKIAEKFNIFQNASRFPLLDTALGPVRGQTLSSYFERPFYGFKGIPYAKKVKTYFENSDVWVDSLTENNEEYDATYFRPKCPQSSMLTSGNSGRLDCLHISIYTPQLNCSHLTGMLHCDAMYPVMVYIHGGSYMTGDASLYIPTKLLDKDIIVVVLQYRLGSIGFLSAGIDSAPGNMGLMDQINALKWVQQNIKDYGGDNTKVTVFGQSAGAASASWMMFTPLTSSEYNDDDLLHRILPESGSAIERWTLDTEPQDSLYLHAEAVGCDTDVSNTEIIECMQGKDLDTIVTGFNTVYSEDRHQGGLGFRGVVPVIQKGLYYESLNDDTLVIREHPLISARDGRHLNVDILTGSVRDEGSLVAGLAWTDFFHPLGLDKNVTFMSTEVLPFFVNAFGIPDITGTVANSLRLAYLRDAVMGDWYSMIGGLIDAFGMMFLKSGGWTLVSVLSNRNPSLNIYFYSFEFESNDSIFDWYFISTPDIPMDGGITHADDLMYLFHMPSYMNDDPKQLQTIRRMTTMWANFAKYGNPTQPHVTDVKEVWEDLVDKWEKFSYTNKKYMLMKDEWHMGVDFTLRWNHFSGLSAENDTADYAMLDVEQVDMDGDQEYSEEGNVAIIALSVTCTAMMLCIILLSFKAFRS